MFVNSYLDEIRRVLSGDFALLAELLDPKKIKDIFEKDCKTIIESVLRGETDVESARRNFFLLKSYAVAQLLLHCQKLSKLAEEKGIRVNAMLKAEDVNEIAMMIEEMEKEI